jgi:hypothetical protein
VEVPAPQPAQLVRTAAEEMALGPGWYDSPADIPRDSDRAADAGVVNSGERVCASCGRSYMATRRNRGLSIALLSGGRVAPMSIAIQQVSEQIDQALLDQISRPPESNPGATEAAKRNRSMQCRIRSVQPHTSRLRRHEGTDRTRSVRLPYHRWKYRPGGATLSSTMRQRRRRWAPDGTTHRLW